MSRNLWIFSTMLILISACAPATQSFDTAQDKPTPEPDHPTSTPSPLPTVTTTPTASITPLSTIPTFTPTFDVSTIVTVTPAPKAECPNEDSTMKLDSKIEHGTIDAVQNILEYLNKGGSTKTILNTLPSSYYPGLVRFEDLTGDGISELAYIHYSDFISGGFYIFTCLNGNYTLYKNETVNWTISFYGVYDMNLNGMPELVIISRGCSGTWCYEHYILEWNGTAQPM